MMLHSLFYCFVLDIVVKWDIAVHQFNESVGQIELCFSLMGELERDIEIVAFPIFESVASCECVSY